EVILFFILPGIRIPFEKNSARSLNFYGVLTALPIKQFYGVRENTRFLSSAKNHKYFFTVSSIGNCCECRCADISLCREERQMFVSKASPTALPSKEISAGVTCFMGKP